MTAKAQKLKERLLTLRAKPRTPGNARQIEKTSQAFMAELERIHPVSQWGISSSGGATKNPKKGSTMARRGKLKGAAKAAFLRRMARGRRKAGIRTNPRRRRRGRRSSPGAVVLVRNPSKRRKGRSKARRRSSSVRRRRSAGGGLSRLLALLPLIGGRSMARRKKRRGTRRARRRNPGALLVNPRRRRRSRRRTRSNPRRRHGRRRYRNPGIVSKFREGFKTVAGAAIPATVGGFLIGLLDTKVFQGKGTAFRVVGKAIAALLTMAVGKRFFSPVGVGIAGGAVLGTIGYEFGIRAGGGVLAINKLAGIQELVEQAATDGETQYALQALIEGVPDTTDRAINYYEQELAGDIPPEYAEAMDDADDE